MSTVRTATETRETKSEEPSPPPPSSERSIQTQRSSQSAVNSEELSPEPSSGGGGGTRSARSQSPSQEDNTTTMIATTTRKRPKRGASSGPSKRHVKSTPDTDRETRTTSQRISKEAREARRAQRELEIKQKMAELDELEQAVENGTHPEFLHLLKEIETKRANRIRITQARYQFEEANYRATFQATQKAADDHYMLQRQGSRRDMMKLVQQKISKLEQEYYSCSVSSSLDEQHVPDWTPGLRPSKLDSVIVPLTEQEADQDFASMRSAVAQQQQQYLNNNVHKDIQSS